jgi:rod shape-determining protein MreC
MKFSKNSLIDLVNILASLILRNLSYLSVLILIFIIMIFKSAYPNYVNNIQNNMINITTSTHELSSNILLYIKNIPSNISSFFYTYQENKDLKYQINEFTSIKNMNDILEAENIELKKTLNFFENKSHNDISAKIIASYNIMSQDVILLSAGANQGVKINQPVINQYGLIGRIIEVYDTSAKILVITDKKSRIPVIFNNSRKYAVVSGGNRECLKVNYIENNNDILDNELVITSGDGGIMPPGIVIGKAIKKENDICVQPSFKDNHFEFVIIKNL